MITIHSDLTSNSQQAFTIENNSKFGEKKQGKVIYSKYEALYLIETGKAVGKIKLKQDEKNNYLVFKDLRKKGYIIKTGLKFGAEFRVYEKNKPHAKYLTYITAEKSGINLKEFISKNRTAHSTAKKLLIAIIDPEQDITYYEVNWTKLS
jgi:tRNA-intron endonuclease, archaea type